MIVRILGEGQYELDDAHVDTLNRLDAAVEAAVADGDEDALQASLVNLLTQVHSLGSPLDDAALIDSDLILPGRDSDLAQLRGWLDDNDAADGLIPG